MKRNQANRQTKRAAKKPTHYSYLEALCNVMVDKETLAKAKEIRDMYEDSLTVNVGRYV